MQEKLLLIGIIFIFLGVLLTIISAFMGSKKVDFAFGGFIGPIPFGWATNEKALFLLIFIMFLALFLLLFR